MTIRQGICLALLACACSSEDKKADTFVEPLSPSEQHYGKSYTEWAGEWSQWFYELTLDESCADPASDTTGEQCGLNQDSKSDVFFLAGDFGGKVKRSKCRVAHGQALFFPLIVSWHDNGGVEAAMQLSDAQLKKDAIAATASLGDVTLSIDDHAVDDLSPYLLEAAPYEYTVPAEPNVYSCQGATGVTGTYSGYSNGYFVMLPPLSAGEHSIAFSATLDTGFALNVSYSPLTVE